MTRSIETSQPGTEGEARSAPSPDPTRAEAVEPIYEPFFDRDGKHTGYTWVNRDEFPVSRSAAPPSTEEGGGLRDQRRLILEDAEALDRTADEADDNNWQDWAATMRQAATRIRALARDGGKT